MIGKHRLKYLITRQGPMIALALVLVGALVIGAAGWMYATPETAEVTDQTNRVTISSGLHSNARVTGNSSLYETGTQLHDPPVYLFSATPTATLNLTTTVPADQSVDVTQEVTVVYTATRDGEPFWQRSSTLAREETTTQSGSVTTRTGLDPRAIQRQVTQLENEIGTAGSVSVRLQYTVIYETAQYEGQLTTTAPLTITDDWYVIGTESVERTHSTPVSRTVTVPDQNRDRYLIAGGLGGLLILAGTGIAGLYYTRLQDIDENALAYHVHRERYTDWISRGKLPESLQSPAIQTESLEDLIDVAIDTGNRAIYDSERELYVVFTDTATYYFDDGGWWTFK